MSFVTEHKTKGVAQVKALKAWNLRKKKIKLEEVSFHCLLRWRFHKLPGPSVSVLILKNVVPCIESEIYHYSL